MKWQIAFLVFLIIWLAPFGVAHADGPGKNGPDGEVSVMGSFSKTDFGNNTYSTSRHYTATLGVNISPITEVELSYSYSDTFFNDDPIQTTSTNEQSLGLSLVQSLVPPQFIIQPYAKAGLAQYNRKQSGTTGGVPNVPTESKSPSAILGGGVRIFLLRNFSLKVEATTYLPNMHIDQGKNNFTVQGGIGWNF
jgi:hypothetical protein